jgi:hypothetical protein
MNPYKLEFPNISSMAFEISATHEITMKPYETSNSSSLQVEVVATAGRRVGRSQQDLQRHWCPADAAEEFEGFVPGLRPCAAWILAIDEENTENTIEKY